MEMRFLGRSGLSVSTLGFGAMTFGEPDRMGRFAHIGATELASAERQIAICIETGVNLFDTADVYAGGSSEEILGKALGTRRRDVVLATKGFGRMGPGAHDIGLSRRHLVEACDASLRRLGTDWIDLYQVHSFDGQVPLEETLRALEAPAASGKVRCIGCSNFAGWQLMKALALADALGVSRFISQQIQYSLMVRDAEQELLPCGVDQGVGALLWSPLAQGFLSGKYRRAEGGDDRLNRSGRLTAYQNARGDAVIDAALIIAAERDVSATQVALNWLRARPGVTSVLFGARTEEQLRDNLAAATWSLSAEEVATLDRASQSEVRYPDSFYRMSSVERNPPLFARYDPA